MSNTSFDIKSNVCEICKQVAAAGIVDDDGIPVKIRYACQDHYMQVLDLANKESKMKQQ